MLHTARPKTPPFYFFGQAEFSLSKLLRFLFFRVGRSQLKITVELRYRLILSVALDSVLSSDSICADMMRGRSGWEDWIYHVWGSFHFALCLSFYNLIQDDHKWFYSYNFQSRTNSTCYWSSAFTHSCESGCISLHSPDFFSDVCLYPDSPYPLLLCPPLQLLLLTPFLLGWSELCAVAQVVNHSDRGSFMVSHWNHVGLRAPTCYSLK